MLTNVTFTKSCSAQADNSGVLSISVTIRKNDDRTVDKVRYILEKSYEGESIFDVTYSEGASTTREFTGIPDRDVYLLRVFSTNTTGEDDFVLSEQLYIDCLPNPLTVSHTKTNVTVYGGSDGTITLTVGGGFTPYAYLWNDGITTKDRTNLPAGTYSCTVSSNDGQSVATGDIIITQPTACDLTITAVTVTPPSFPRIPDAVAVITATTSNEGPIEYSLDNVNWQSSDTFTGLAEGSHTAYVRQYACSDDQAFTVTRPPARYKGHYGDHLGHVKRVEIQERGFNGTTEEVRLEASPVIITVNGEGEERYQTILGSSCDVNIICEENFKFLHVFTSDNRQYRVEIYNESNNDKLYWTGYVVPELYRESYMPTPYPVTITATDGLGMLKYIEYNSTEPFINGFELIRQAISKLDLYVDFATAIEVYEAAMDTTVEPLSQLEVHKGENYYELLHRLLFSFYGQVYWNEQDCRFQLIRYAYRSSVYPFRLYNWKGELKKQGITQELAIIGKPCPTITTRVFFVEDGRELEIIPGYRQIKLNSPFKQTAPLIDLSAAKGWNSESESLIIDGWFYKIEQALEADYAVKARPVAMRQKSFLGQANKFKFSFMVNIQRVVGLEKSIPPHAVFALRCGGYYLDQNDAWQASFQLRKIAAGNPSLWYDYTSPLLSVPADGILELVIFPAEVAEADATDEYRTTFKSFSSTFYPYGKDKPEEEQYVGVNDPRYLYTPSELDLYHIDGQASIYNHAIKVKGQISKLWHRKDVDESKPIAQLLAESILDDYARPAQRIRASILGRMAMVSSIAHPFNGNRVFALQGVTLDDAACIYQGEWLEVLGVQYFPDEEPSCDGTTQPTVNAGLFDDYFDDYFE
jgi:hypothetical protein